MKNIFVAFAFLVSSARAFAPMKTPVTCTTTTCLSATIPQEWKDKAAVASAALVTANLPVWASFAIEDDYEYGAVDAPPLVPIVGGVLAIATALLPIALRPGEEAFEEVSSHGSLLVDWGSGRRKRFKRRGSVIFRRNPTILMSIVSPVFLVPLPLCRSVSARLTHSAPRTTRTSSTSENKL